MAEDELRSLLRRLDASARALDGDVAMRHWKELGRVATQADIALLLDEIASDTADPWTRELLTSHVGELAVGPDVGTALKILVPIFDSNHIEGEDNDEYTTVLIELTQRSPRYARVALEELLDDHQTTARWLLDEWCHEQS